MSQVRPQLSVNGRWLLVQRVLSERPVAHVAAELGVSRATGYKWWRRWREEGDAGLQSRSSRPARSPNRSSLEREARSSYSGGDSGPCGRTCPATWSA